MNKAREFLLLPKEISAFEGAYLKRLNRVGLGFLAAHVPVFTLVAWANGTGPLPALVLTTLVLVGPLVAWLWLGNPRTVSLIYAVAAMGMGGLLVHFGQGPVQIEMHFYFFAVVAMLAVFGNPMVIVAAAGTVALHHLLLWLVIPASVFNYQAPVWVVGVHAGFVVLESVATCFIARSFFDNVIGLEKVVASRTAALDRRNLDMRQVLDNVRQGFATMDRSGVLASERSAAFDAWFGCAAEGATFFDLLATRFPEFAARTRAGWSQVCEGFMTLELTLDQMPSLLVDGDREMSVEYRPIGEGETPATFLVVITDVSATRQRERADVERREDLKLFEMLLTDRTGCATFFAEASKQVASIMTPPEGDLADYKRALHTLTGNAAVFGLDSVAEICRRLETHISEERSAPPPAERRVLAERWSRLANEMSRLLGAGRDVIEVEQAEHAELEAVIRHGISKELLLRRVHELKLDRTKKRLDGFAEQAKAIAARLQKGEIDVVVEANGLRVDAARWGDFWSAFVHPVRNAVDHGLERPDERVAAGKARTGHIALRTFFEASSFVVEIEDDGRGVDWQSVVARGQSMGIEGKPTEELLFVDGLSTAKRVTEISGRGVGLGALREATLSLGGTLNVTSRPGVGTLLRMVFPEEATMPGFLDRASLEHAA